jgi:hypothetical protein
MRNKLRIVFAGLFLTSDALAALDAERRADDIAHAINIKIERGTPRGGDLERRFACQILMMCSARQF